MGSCLVGGEANAACPGCATAAALADSTARLGARLAAVGGTFAYTAQVLAATAVA